MTRFALIRALCAALVLSVAATTGSAQQADLPVEITASANIGQFDKASRLSSDRRRAALMQGNTVQLWDIAGEPRLVRRFEMGSHVFSTAISADGRVIAGGSSGRTAVWDAATGRVLRTFTDGVSTAYALELSDDGSRFYAAGGSFGSGSKGSSVAGWNVATGTRLFAFNSRGSDILRKSPDGRLFAADLQDWSSRKKVDRVVVFDGNGKIIRSLATNSTQALAFSPDNRLLATGATVWLGNKHADAGALKVWDLSTGQLAKTLPAPEYSADVLDWSPDGKVLVSSDRSTTKFWNTRDWTLRREFKSRSTYAGFLSNSSVLLSYAGLRRFDIETGADAVAVSRFSGDYASVVIGNTAVFAQQNGIVDIDLVNGGVTRRAGQFAAYKVSQNRKTVTTRNGELTFQDLAGSEPPRVLRRGLREGFTLALSAAGDLVAMKEGNNVEIIETSNGRTALSLPHAYPFGIDFSPDGRRAVVARKGSVEIIDVATRSMARAASDASYVGSVRVAPDGQSFIVATGHYTAAQWSTSGPRLMRKFELKNERDGSLFDVAFHPTASQAAFAPADGRIRLVSLDTGGIAREFVGHTTSVYQLAFSQNGNRLMSRAHDGVKIWDTASGALLVTYFITSQGEWAAMTPEGFFDASEKGADVISVVRGLEVLSIDQVFQTMYRPDLVREKLAGDPGGKVRAAAARLDLTKVVSSGSAPKVQIASPASGALVNDDRVTVTAEIAPQAGGLGRIEWRVNGVTLGIEEKPDAPADGSPLKLSRELALEEGDNRIEIVAFNTRNLIASEPARLDVRWEATGARAQPRLFVMAVGVNDYWDGRIRLNYAASDARAIGRAFEAAGKGVYQEVVVTTLLDDQVTKPSLERAFTELAGKVRPRDVFVFFLAGHGKTIEGNYYFLPQDFRYRGDESIARDGVGQDQWQSWLARIAAKKSVLIYDTCESGSLTGERVAMRGLERVAALERMTRAMGRTVLTASTDDAPALEGYQGHGVLTYAVLDALGRADMNQDGYVDVTELAGFVDARVPEISEAAFRQRQVPQMKIVGSNFALLAKTSVLASAPAGDSKPVPSKPTHVVIVPADILDVRGGSVVQTIAPGTQVVALEAAEGWTIVARDGRRLGYLRAEQLLPLQ